MNVVKYGALALTLVMSQTASASFWGKVKNAFNDCKYDETEYQQVYQFEKETTAKLDEHFTGRFTEQDFTDKPWMKDFRYVIVVNKASRGATAQTMRVYESGLLIHQTKVSTGRENLELRRKNKVCTGAPPKSYWSQTPTGFYTPKYLSKDHKSSSWDSDMPFAIFFDLDNGLALHEVYPKYKEYLGSRASGGCIRQDKETAAAMFERVQATEGATVPMVNIDGTPVLDEQGQVKYANQQFWTSARTGETVKFNTFSALIIVEDVKE
ncbi:L,D-transpeptidase [uncultured Bdellovibrio sp.]|uniref:L,D-transpeptidase n=1 Tax=Bdellovibrio sp. HCB-162 TaxID=3394234 RepID=UPI0025FD066D|nr:L,D-transpeptidase [uncultured Bdellovibrio sp.]